MTYEEEKIRDLITTAFKVGRLFERAPENFTPETTENDLIFDLFLNFASQNKELWLNSKTIRNFLEQQRKEKKND